MKIRHILLSTLFSLVLMSSPTVVLADSVKTMAEILIHLNHHPSGSEKNTLRGIANDNSVSEHERVIATALVNLEHKASSADKTKLMKIMDDSSAPANAREMAAIIHNLKHKPSSADKDKLHGMM